MQPHSKKVERDDRGNTPVRPKPSKKSFAIEHRYLRRFADGGRSEWRVWKRYATERQRDEALAALKKKEMLFGKPFMEYRKAVDNGD